MKLQIYISQAPHGRPPPTLGLRHQKSPISTAKSQTSCSEFSEIYCSVVCCRVITLVLIYSGHRDVRLFNVRVLVAEVASRGSDLLLLPLFHI